MSDNAEQPVTVTVDNPAPQVDPSDNEQPPDALVPVLLKDEDTHVEESSSHAQRRFERATSPFIAVEGSSAADVIAGSQHKIVNNYFSTQDSEQLEALEVDMHEKLRIRSIYVCPDAYNDARRILERQRVLILWGVPGLGKATTAKYVLLEYKEQLVRLSPTASLSKLCDYNFDSAHGYLIDGLIPGNTQALSDFVLSSMAQKLREQQSYLVITAHNLSPTVCASIHDYVLHWNQLPEPQSVLEQHLNWIEDDTAVRESIQQLIAAPAIQAFLQTRPRLQDLSELAALLSKASDNELGLDQLLQQLSRTTQKQVQEWFDKPERTVREHCLMLTLAIFSSANQHIVKRAFQQLYTLLDPPQPDQATLPAPEPDRFTSLKKRCEAVCATAKKVIEQTPIGPAEVTIICFDNPFFQRLVLDHVAAEYDHLFSVLLTWLSTLGYDSDSDVRDRAAAAVGQLGTHDTNTVVDTVIAPWARDGRWQGRQAAAVALQVLAAHNNQCFANVVGRLRAWSNVKSAVQLKRTAANAFGYIGFYNVNLALVELRQLTRVPRANQYLINEVVSSVSWLFEAYEDNVEGLRFVLDTLLSWTAPDQGNQALTISTGLLIFRRLARNMYLDAVPLSGRWPTLLWLLCGFDDCRAPISTLWQRLLNQRSFTNDAMHSVLREWLRVTDGDSRLYPGLVWLVCDIGATSTNDFERLEVFLNNRVTDPKETSPSAAMLLKKLRQSQVEKIEGEAAYERSA